MSKIPKRLPFARSTCSSQTLGLFKQPPANRYFMSYCCFLLVCGPRIFTFVATTSWPRDEKKQLNIPMSSIETTYLGIVYHQPFHLGGTAIVSVPKCVRFHHGHRIRTGPLLRSAKHLALLNCANTKFGFS